MLEQVLLRHIRAVGDRDAHRERHRVEHLAARAEHGRGRELREIRHQIVLEACQSARDGQRIERDDDDQNGEHRHHEAACVLDALLHAEDDDKTGDEYKKHEPRGRAAEVQHGRRERTGVEADEAAEKAAVVRCLERTARNERPQVLHDPAADDTVIRGDDERDKGRNPAEKTEPLVECAVGADARQLGLAADRELGDHQRKAEGHDQNQIHEQKDTAAVTRRQIREAPEIAQTDSRSRRRQNKADAARETASLLFFHSLLSSPDILLFFSRISGLCTTEDAPAAEIAPSARCNRKAAHIRISCVAIKIIFIISHYSAKTNTRNKKIQENPESP